MISTPLVIVVGVAALAVAGFSIWKTRHLQLELRQNEENMKRRVYELAILKELGERIGYSLNVQNIIDVITGSLHQFIEYSVACSMLLEPDKIIFKAHLEESVSEDFVAAVRERMLGSLAALLNQDLSRTKIEEVLSGAILVDDLDEPVRSFFNIPLIIRDKVAGVITVAHKRAGLYKEEEMTILYKITKQASHAVSKLEEVVATEQRKLNAMVESMSEGVLMTDRDFRVVVANPAMRNIVGLVATGDVSIFDFIGKMGNSFDLRGKLEESIRLDKMIESSEIIVSDKYYQVLVSPVKAASDSTADEVLGGVALFHDLTEEKEVERLRDDFTSMMVHELRSPLDGIRALAELMRGGKARRNTKNYREYVDLIFQSSSKMLELVNDLLDTAKIESGEFQIYPKEIHTRKLLEDGLAFFVAQAAEKDIKLTVTIHDDVPTTVWCDPDKIAHVLRNLVSNAIKFTAIGGTVALQSFVHAKGGIIEKEAARAGFAWRIGAKEIGAVVPGDALIVAVEDTGVGIPAKYLGQLFSKFKQFHDSAVSGKEGTGLGLVVAKGIVEAHGGVIRASSEEGLGSVFYFSLPLQKTKSTRK